MVWIKIDPFPILNKCLKGQLLPCEYDTPGYHSVCLRLVFFSLSLFLMLLHIIDSIKFAVHAGSQNCVRYVTFNSPNEMTA